MRASDIDKTANIFRNHIIDEKIFLLSFDTWEWFILKFAVRLLQLDIFGCVFVCEWVGDDVFRILILPGTEDNGDTGDWVNRARTDTETRRQYG